MRLTIVGALLAAASFQPAKADPAGDALLTKARECIQASASTVAPAAQGLMDATNFLVDGLCAAEVRRADNYAVNARTLSNWQAKNSSTQLAGVSIDPATGEIVTPPGFGLPFDSSSTFLSDLHRATPRTDLVAFAARAVLAARTTHR